MNGDKPEKKYLTGLPQTQKMPSAFNNVDGIF